MIKSTSLTQSGAKKKQHQTGLILVPKELIRQFI